MSDGHSFTYQKLSPSRRHVLRLFPTFILFVTVLSTIALSYRSYGYYLDKQSLSQIRSLDFHGPISHEHYGKKTVDRWGRLKRQSSKMQCGVMWSNYGICSSNAIMHSNCIEICDTSYSTCSGCSVLQTNHDAQLALAHSHCTTKRDAVCDLNTLPNGHLDYVSFSTCCLSAAGPVGDAACLCSNQQFASANCFGYGTCQPSTCTIQSQICPGTFTATSPPPPTCDDPGAITCSGPGTDMATKCGKKGAQNQQTVLQLNSNTCAFQCDAGVAAVDPVTGDSNFCSAATYYSDSNYPNQVGCYNTITPLANQVFGANGVNVLSPEDCTAQCKILGYSYCGLTKGGFCYGDNSINPSASQVIAEYCRVVCTDDSNYFCGGRRVVWVLSV